MGGNVGTRVGTPEDATSVRRRVLICDICPTFVRGAASLLSEESNLALVAEAASCEAALALVSHAGPIDLVVVDVRLPSEGGFALVRTLHAHYPNIPVLALCVHAKAGMAADMLRAGAIGLALRSQQPVELVEAMRRTSAGERYLARAFCVDDVNQVLGSPSRLERLTRREWEVFRRLARGETTSAVASSLFISQRTVETHQYRIMAKLGVHSMIELFTVASDHGLASW